MTDSLIVATLNYPPAHGGIEQMCYELVTQFVQLGLSVHVVAPSIDGTADFDGRAPYKITRFPHDKYRHLRLSAHVARLIAQGGDRVLFAQWTAAGPVAMGRRFLGSSLRLASIAHGKEFLRPRSGVRAAPFRATYLRGTLRNLDAVFAVSRYTGERARQAGARNVRLVRPGVDCQRFRPDASRHPPTCVTSDKGPFLLSVARLVPRKGIDTVIGALPRLIQAYPGLCYLVAGDGEDRGRLQQLSQQLGVRSHVQFLGRCSDDEVTALHAAADLFLLQSRQDLEAGDVEGLGLVLLEAQASGTPVVAARSGGMPDALLEGETGVLVPPGDSSALADALNGLLGDRTRMQRMSEAARRFACEHSWRDMARSVWAEIEISR